MQSSYREVLRCLLEGVQWLTDPSVRVRPAGKSGISQARTRLGFEALKRLHDEVVRPIATQTTRGAWYRRWHLVSLDGSTLDVADEEDNDRAFGRQPSRRGETAYPQVRFVSLVENGTHVLFGTRMGAYRAREPALAEEPLTFLSGACSAWLTAISSGLPCGTRPCRPGPIFCGEPRRTIVFPVKKAVTTVPI